MIKRKRLYFDIETSPNVGFFWNAGYKQNIPYENIITERAIICICYKWEGEKKVSSLHWDKKQSDKKMLQEFIKVANKSDEMIGHNGDKFDLTWIRTRCLFHNIPMFPEYKTIDTLKFSRSKFRFNSNRLNYLGQYLGLGSKLKTGFDLWRNIVLSNCDKSLNKMIRYCKRDVLLLESVFQRLNNYLPAKTHYGVIGGAEKNSCPECGGRLIGHKRRVSAAGVAKLQSSCRECGKYHTIPEKSEKTH